MSTHSQIRARNALAASRVNGIGAGKQGGDTISGFPMLIKQCGLLPALAFAIEEKNQDNQIVPKHKGALLIAGQLAVHLRELHISTAPVPGTPQNDRDRVRELKALVDELAAPTAPAANLRRATDEAIAWLSFLKRFVA